MTALDLAEYTLHLAQARQGGTLRWGSRNRPAIKALQERLSSLGFATEVDGQWGADTEKQFRAFQHSTGLKTDGVLGPKSLDQLLKSKPKDVNAADPSISAIQRVVQGGAPVAARNTAGLGQIKAQQHGGGAPVAGAAKPGGSTAAVPVAKGPHGGRIDPVTGGEVATSTTGPIGSTDPAHAHTPRAEPQPVQPQNNNAAFNELHPREGGKFAKKGDTGEPVSNTQMALNTTNKAGLKVDGQFGSKTEKQVKTFQKANNLQADGIVGPLTSGALRRKLNAIQTVHAPVPPPVAPEQPGQKKRRPVNASSFDPDAYTLLLGQARLDLAVVFNEQLHPRDINGHFRDTLNKLPASMKTNTPYAVAALKKQHNLPTDQATEIAKHYSQGLEGDQALAMWSDQAPVVDKDGVLGLMAYMGGGHKEMNGLLRGKKQLGMDAKQSERRRVWIEGIDKLMAQSRSTNSSVLHRGMKAQGKFKVGDVVSDAGYFSASTDRSVAEHFAGAKGRLLTVRVPVGVPGLDMRQTLANAGVKGRVEKEVVLPRGARFKVLSVNGTEVELEFVPD